MKKYIFSLLCFLGIFFPVNSYSQYNGYKDWPRDERQMAGRFFLTDEAMQLAETVMEFQLSSGAWPKNIYYPQVTSDEVSALKKKYAEKTLGTMENSATLTEIHFLSNMYQATAQRSFRKAAEQGIDFVLSAQYTNGGWPLCFPSKDDHDAQISFKDGTMVNILLFLNEIIQKKEPYSYLTDADREKAKEAFNKGIAYILNTQVRQNGTPTVWCAQYQADSYLPCSAGVSEPACFSSSDSASVALLLMGISNPDAFVKAAIEGAVSWFRQTAIKGKQRENYINKEGKRDFRLVSDPHAADMWSKYYSVEDNQSVFTESDGEMKHDVAELTHNRRVNVSWFTNEPQKVLRRYERWKQKNN